MGNAIFKFLTGDIRIPSRSFVAVTFVTSGILAWFFLLEVYFADIFSTFTLSPFWVFIGEATFFGFSAFSAIIGSVISEKINRRKLLLSSITLAVLTTALLAVCRGIVFSLFSSILLGMSLGLGFPSSTALLADYTVVEERARVSGIIVLETFIMVSLAATVVSLLSFGLIGIILLCIALRSTSFLALAIDPCERKRGKEGSWRSVLAYKDFVFYLFPWIMFNVASGVVSFVWLRLQSPDYTAAFRIAVPLRYTGAAIFGLISGVVADRVGRKQPIIIGLVMLGVSFAFLGLATSPLSVIVYLTISGIAWGGFMVIYIAVLGDLAFPGSREKFYALGMGVPLIIYMSLSSIPAALGISAAANTLSPVLSIILFLSVIPVLYASETLPETEMRERRLREHVRKVSKLVQESKKPK
jgi:MFS family permease